MVNLMKLQKKRMKNQQKRCDIANHVSVHQLPKIVFVIHKVKGTKRKAVDETEVIS